MNNKLAKQTQKTAGIGNGMRTATIAAVSGSAVTISVGGGQITAGVGVVGTYVPVVGDTVAVFRQDSSWLILGPTGDSINGGTITGTTLVSFTALAIANTPASFGATFAVPPVVIPNIDTATGVGFRWSVRATAITTTGFNIYAFSGDAATATWTDIPVSWTATAR